MNPFFLYLSVSEGMWLAFLRKYRMSWFLSKETWKKNGDMASILEEQQKTVVNKIFIGLKYYKVILMKPKKKSRLRVVRPNEKWLLSTRSYAALYPGFCPHVAFFLFLNFEDHCDETGVSAPTLWSQKASSVFA